MTLPPPAPPGSPAAPVASPCINVCRMHAGTGWCEGCLRTLDEIAGWSRLDDAGKRAVLAHLPERRRHWRSVRAAPPPMPPAEAPATAPPAAPETPTA